MDASFNDDLIQLSAIQHIAFCERQCYLIHVEQIWEDNAFTIAGDIAHERVDSEEVTYTKDGLKQVRSLLLNSKKYGLSGRADLVEFDEKRGLVYPVEYKVGKPKTNDCDAVQLCAQAFCLEEMLNIHIPQGAIYYGKTCQRFVVDLSEQLREKTAEQIRQVHKLFQRETPPPAVYSSERCQSCSLKDLCFPKLFRLPEPSRYLHDILRKDDQ